MSRKIKLDIVSDVVCPWCIIGYNNLQAAINELELQDKIDIEWQPFELNPDMSAEGENLRDHIARKYGSSPEESANARERITAAGAEHGFLFNYFDEMKMVNTLDAHILLDYAKQHGKQTDLKLKLFNAFFTEQKDISDRTILRQELGAIGLNVNDGMVSLDKTELRNEIKNQEVQWQQMGITGVPTVIFNRESAVTGAQPVENYKQILLELSKGLD
ncbi:2-hydroxychromene-2-carboxylate isomerase [Vibrio inusitatus NBRC 102082]|uniref:2-hydroxychromene-2-carboxylate isomerase n=1 Tax=Vibrio inusitatus NBRC 102082 TaxID=1219070 RepID=A0A4Y3HT31_9VIBR|nr:DsbA family oxidoreductase [Vibrio inusitatus]GEA50309.1 2-hydroxychromene-2-carboxylate isomerase [Vibrio inusitatus NBRC 102082]